MGRGGGSCVGPVILIMLNDVMGKNRRGGKYRMDTLFIAVHKDDSLYQVAVLYLQKHYITLSCLPLTPPHTQSFNLKVISS